MGNFEKTSRSLGLFKDDKGVLRAGGRLKNSALPLDTVHPMILPPEHHVTGLIIQKAHESVFHNGTKETLVQLRARFWIVRGRQIVKKHINSCNICRKLEGLAYGSPNMSQLPRHRVEGNKAFSAIGVDFCGPHFCGGEVKSYIALLTC